MMDLSRFKQKLSNDGLAAWKFATPVEYFWCFEVRASREQVWSFLKDTSRLNREMGFGPREQNEANGRLLVKTKMIGLEQVWIEEPWLWLSGHTMTSTRLYKKGLAEKMYSVFHIESSNDQTQRVYVYFGWQPKSAFWSWFLRSTASVLQNKFAEALKKIEMTIAQAPVSIPKFKEAPVALGKPTLDKLKEFESRLLEKGLDSKAVSNLVDAVIKRDDLDLEPIRILAFAEEWAVDEREALKTCLHATRMGLLKLSWDVICPHCRGTRFSAKSLGEIPEASQCEVCEIGFTTSEENSIEVMFHVHPSVRKVEALSYCAAEPAKKNHIFLQGSVEAGMVFNPKVQLAPGHYIARIQGRSSVWKIEVDPRSTNTKVELNPKTSSYQVAENFDLQVFNPEPRDVLFVIESPKWDRKSLRPAKVLALPEFRDLFSKEHLNSSVKLYLGEQVILFTDIVGSTQFYENVGDAKAFSAVRQHFQDVFKLVERHRGVVVKTIGDSVMASFSTIAEAVSAAIVIQETYPRERRDTAIRLRVSVHSGPVIAVQLNTGLDFFGSTVNQAAKNQTMASITEVVCSEEVYQKYLKDNPVAYPMEVRKNSRENSSPNPVYVLKVSAKEKSRLQAS